MSSAPVATQYSYDFIRLHSPPQARSILEVGCGKGELAASLAKDGLDVIALDSSEDCVSLAKARGVDARTVRWPAALDQRFDAVLFTRSLHHIVPLQEAVDAAIDALQPVGTIIVEDFRSELESARTTAWFIGLMRMLDAAGAFANPAALQTLLEKLELSEHHELHRSTAIAHALSRHGVVHEEDAAYYFRYAEAELDEKRTEELLHYELAMIGAGSIDALGKRFVLRL